VNCIINFHQLPRRDNDYDGDGEDGDDDDDDDDHDDDDQHLICGIVITVFSLGCYVL